MTTLPTYPDGTPISQNDGIECDEWVRETPLFRPLCGQEFYPGVGDDTCNLCVAPRIEPVPEAPCSVRMLPDPSRTYLLSVETPFNVSFEYPGLSPWNDDVANPGIVNMGAGGPSSTMPATSIITDSAGSYEYRTQLPLLGDIWSRSLVNVNPTVLPGGFIVPGNVQTVGSKLQCSWSASRTQTIVQGLNNRMTLISPPDNTVSHPTKWNFRSEHTKGCVVTMSIVYLVETPNLTVPDWDSPSTKYLIRVTFTIREIGGGVPYWKSLTQSVPTFQYGAPEELMLNPVGVVAPCWVPWAYASRSYEFSTSDKAAFMAASMFELTRRDTKSYAISGSVVYDLANKTTPKLSDDAIFAVWGGGLGWTTYAPSTLNNTYFTTGDMSTGWPTKLVVTRIPVVTT